MKKGSFIITVFFILSFSAGHLVVSAEKEPGKEERISVTRDEKKKDILIEFRLKKAGNVIFSHRKHVLEKNVPCDICHKSLMERYKKKATQKGKSYLQVLDKEYCAVCHSGKVSFSVNDSRNCQKCHQERKKK